MAKESAESASAQDAENALKKELESRWVFKRHPDIRIRYIGDGILASGTGGRAEMYHRIDANGKIERLFNVDGIRKDPFFDAASRLSWYREISDSGKRELYRLKEIDGTTAKPLPGAVPIDPFSPEYFRAWETTAFVSDVLAAKAIEKPVSGKYEPVDEKLLDAIARSKALRLSDLRSYYDRGQISASAYERLEPVVRNNLASQITDARFDLAGYPVTQKELDSCFVRNLIDADVHSRLSEKLKARKMLEDRKVRERNRTIQDSEEKRKSLR